MFIKYLCKYIHKNQNTDWPWEGITGLLGTKVDFFFTVYTPVLWELKKTTPPPKKIRKTYMEKVSESLDMF